MGLVSWVVLIHAPKMKPHIKIFIFKFMAISEILIVPIKLLKVFDKQLMVLYHLFQPNENI